MKTTTILFLASIFIMISSYQALGEEWTTEQKEVWNSVEKYWDSIKKGDVESALAGQHKNILVLESDNPSTFKKDQIRSWCNYWVNQLVPTFIKLKPMDINIIENVATVFYLFKWESENREISSRGWALSTLIKTDNKWLEVGSLYSSGDQPAPCPHAW